MTSRRGRDERKQKFSLPKGALVNPRKPEWTGFGTIAMILSICGGEDLVVKAIGEDTLLIFADTKAQSKKECMNHEVVGNGVVEHSRSIRPKEKSTILVANGNVSRSGSFICSSPHLFASLERDCACIARKCKPAYFPSNGQLNIRDIEAVMRLGILLSLLSSGVHQELFT